MNFSIKIFIIFIFPNHSFSQSIWDKSPNIGYWFYKEFHSDHSINKKNLKQNKFKCLNYNTWSTNCGFIDPIKLGLNKEKTFLFEQKEYKQLLQDYAMNPNDIYTAFQWQKFNDWVISQAMMAAYSSEFNTAQHPELDSTITHPFSQFGNLIIKNINNKIRENFFNMLSKTSLLVFFSRSNCSFCHYQANIVRLVADHTHIPTWNASLDEKPLANFKNYLVSPDTLKPAQYLHVSTVPTLFLYLAPQLEKDSQEHWIRLATGLTSAESIEERILRFVKGYQQGLLGGVMSIAHIKEISKK